MEEEELQTAPEPAAPSLVRDGGDVAIRDDDGTVSMVAARDLDRAMAEGARPATETEWQSAKLGKGGEAAAAAIGAGQGISFGYALPGMVGAAKALGADELAEDFRRGAQIAKDTSPNAMLGGEVAGSLAPLAMGLGGGGAAVTAESGLGRAAQRFAQVAPRAFGEGAVIGVGQQLTEDTLGNHDLAAQKYLGAGIKGGLLGLFLGGGIAAGGGAVGDRIGQRAARGLAGSIEGAGVREEMTAYRTAATRAEEAATGGASKGILARGIETAEEQAFKSTGAMLRDWQKLGTTAEQQGERARRIGRTLLDEGIVTGTASQEKIAQRLSEKTREVGGQLSKLRAKLDTAAVRPSTADIADRVFKEVIVPLESTPGMKTEAAVVREYMDDLLSKAGESPSFKQLHEFRRALDDKLAPKLFNKLPQTATPAAQQLGEVRRIMEQEFETAGEKAALELGESFGGEYRLAKQLYGDLKTAEKIAVKTTSRGNANRAISLTDTIMGGAGLVASGPAGLAAAALNKGVREYGNQAAADLLYRASKLEGVQQAATKIDDHMQRAVAAFFGGKALPAAARKASPRATSETVRALREATRSPEALTARVEDAIGARDLHSQAPRVAQAMSTTIMRAAAYVNRKLPLEQQPAGLSFSPQKPRPMSAQSLAKTQRVLDSLDMEAALDSLAKKRLSRDHVEAMKEVYPEMYAQIQSEIRKQATTGKRPRMTVQQEVAMSILFDEPVSAMMQPKKIQGLQSAFAEGAEQSGGQGPKRPLGAPSGALASATNRLEASDA